MPTSVNVPLHAQETGESRTRVSITGEKCACREYNTGSRVLCAEGGARQPIELQKQKEG